jgi:hypothetical protein
MTLSFIILISCSSIWIGIYVFFMIMYKNHVFEFFIDSKNVKSLFSITK